MSNTVHKGAEAVRCRTRRRSPRRGLSTSLDASPVALPRGELSIDIPVPDDGPSPVDNGRSSYRFGPQRGFFPPAYFRKADVDDKKLIRVLKALSDPNRFRMVQEVAS